MTGPNERPPPSATGNKKAIESSSRDSITAPIHSVQGMLSGARWAVMLQATGQIISWLSTILVVRFVSPTDYGLFAMLEAPLELLLLVGLLGMDVALVRTRNIEPKAESAAFGLLLLMGLLLFCLFFFGAHLIADYNNQHELITAAQVLSPIFLLTPFRVIPNAILDRTFQFKTRAKLELISKICAAGCTLTTAYLGAGYWALVGGILSERIIYAVLISIKHPWIIRPSLQIKDAKQLISFGGINAISSGTQILTSKGVGIIAAPLLGTAAMGVYALATQLALLPLSKAMPILNRILVPAFVQLSDDRPAAAKRLTQAISIALVVIAPVMIGLATLSRPFVEVVFGNDWAIAALPLGIYSAIMPLRLINQFLRLAITSLGKPWMLIVSVVPALLIVAPLTYWTAPHGVVALVLLWCAVEPITLLIGLTLCNKVLPLPATSLIEAIAPALVGCICLAASIWATLYALSTEHAAIQLVVGATAGVAAYVLALSMFFRKALVTAYSVIRG